MSSCQCCNIHWCRFCFAERLPEGLSWLEGSPFYNLHKGTSVDPLWPWPCCDLWPTRAKIGTKKKKDPADKMLSLMNFHFSTRSVAWYRPRLSRFTLHSLSVLLERLLEIRLGGGEKPRWKVCCSHQALSQRLQAFGKKNEYFDFAFWPRLFLEGLHACRLLPETNKPHVPH